MGLWGTWTCSVTTLESTGIAYWKRIAWISALFQMRKKRCAAKADQWSSWCFFWFSCRCCRWHVIFCSQQPSSKNEFHQLKFQQDFLVKTGKKLGKTTKPSWFNSWKRASFLLQEIFPDFMMPGHGPRGFGRLLWWGGAKNHRSGVSYRII